MLAGPVFLIGHMACGKSTLGTALRQRTGIVFIDLDAEIERAAHRSIARIFAEHGEEAFRKAESYMLHRIIGRTAGQPAVIACGGGTPCVGSNMDDMLAAGRVIWLRADDAVTLRRLLAARDSRPRLRGLDTDGISALMEADTARRDPFYSRAHSIFDSSRLDTEDEIEQSVTQFISTYL